jgi:hypothetical protein
VLTLHKRQLYDTAHKGFFFFGDDVSPHFSLREEEKTTTQGIGNPMLIKINMFLARLTYKDH